MAKRTFKLKKKISGGSVTYRKWAEWEEGDVLIGKYIGQKEDQYQKPNWMLKVLDAQFMDTDLGEELIDKTIGLNSAGQLDKAMEQIEEGQIVQVTYNGTSEIERGKFKGKDAHVIEVDLVEEDGAEEEDESEEETEEEEVEDEEDDL